MVNNPYPLPNDEVEKDRLDDLQECLRSLLGANVVVPLRRSPIQIGTPCFATQALIVVDIGTGSGKWVLEVADEFPSARVIGLDLSPIQPTFVARNAEFIVEDVNEGMSFSDASTDLVHSR
jgi:tRNA G46 methylase TrmB